MTRKIITLTARAPTRIDSAQFSLRRGFIDAATPLRHVQELQLPLAEQRSLVMSWIRELLAERADLYPSTGKTSTQRSARKNINYKINTRPMLRNKVRRSKDARSMAVDRYLACGREIQILQRLLAGMKGEGENTSCQDEENR